MVIVGNAAAMKVGDVSARTMSNPMSYASLIERLRKATVPSRELDWELHEISVGDFLREHGYRRVGDSYITETPPFPGAERCSGPEFYSSSIDAALAQVEKMLPGCDIYMEIEQVHGGFCQYIFIVPGGVLTPLRKDVARAGKLFQTWKEAKDMLPLAILIALLTALEAQHVTAEAE